MIFSGNQRRGDGLPVFLLQSPIGEAWDAEMYEKRCLDIPFLSWTHDFGRSGTLRPS